MFGDLCVDVCSVLVCSVGILGVCSGTCVLMCVDVLVCSVGIHGVCSGTCVLMLIQVLVCGACSGTWCLLEDLC